MFIVENRSSSLSKRDWRWRVVLWFLVIGFGVLTMHVQYDPDK